MKMLFAKNIKLLKLLIVLNYSCYVDKTFIVVGHMLQVQEVKGTNPTMDTCLFPQARN